MASASSDAENSIVSGRNSRGGDQDDRSSASWRNVSERDSQVQSEFAMILDIGCGQKPEGDLNLDIGRMVEVTPHGGRIRSHCNIIADSLHLPFRDKSIEIVYSSHTIEHVNDPTRFI